MSAWNVWSSLGMYPYNPARAELVLASPLFPKIEIKRPTGKTITVTASGAGPYVSGLKFNGTDSDKPWVPASLVQDGGTLDYTLSDTPTTWGASQSPPSLSDPPSITVTHDGQTITVHAADTLTGIDGTPSCTVDGAPLPVDPATWTATVSASSSHTVTCTATNAFGTSASASDTTWPSTTVGGTVPATLSLTLGGPASFGAFTPGVAKDYTALTTANVTSTAGDAALSVSAAHLTNGAFSLAQPVEVTPEKTAWSGPVSNDAFAIGFKQSIGANEALRTGAYSATLTFTLSTTSP
jgi:hypothetical protein